MPSKQGFKSSGQPSSNLGKDLESDDTSSDDLSRSGNRDSLWGWIIVFASFVCNVIVDGIIFSFGVLILEISKTFQQPKANTAWIGSLQAGFYLLVGPIVSTLANRFGCRAVTIAGSFIASLGFILSYFATSVTWLCLSYGVVSGIGLGFIYLPAIVMVGHYFERRRAFATGIAVCGSGVGAFLMAPIVQHLNDCYGWRGCLLILAGIVLNCIVFGGLFRPLESDSDQESDGSSKPLLGRSKDSWLESDGDNTRSGLADSFSSSQANRYHELEPSKSKSRRYTISEGIRTKPLRKTGRTNRVRGGSINVNFLLRDEVLYSALSLQDFRHHSRPGEPGLQFAAHNKQNGGADDGSASCSKLLDLSLLLSPSFLLLGLSGFLTLAGFFIPFMYIVDRAVQIGTTPEKSAFLLSIIGITNTVGRVFCGWISDSPKVWPLLINNIALVISGTVTMISPLIFNTFVSLAVYCSIFGFAIACFVALRSVITVELLGLGRLTSAFGLLLLPQGIATIIGGPVAGWFFDITGSYDASFYIAGAVILVSGLMCFPLGVISKWEQSRHRRKSSGQC